MRMDLIPGARVANAIQTSLMGSSVNQGVSHASTYRRKFFE